jgi:hypothetical protein
VFSAEGELLRIGAAASCAKMGAKDKIDTNPTSRKFVTFFISPRIRRPHLPGSYCCGFSGQ